MHPRLDDKPGGHWTLIIADIYSGKIYIFGVEPGLETEAQMVARNIATLVNNYRLVVEEGQVQWITPFYFTPLYYGTAPDDHDGGIRIISLAESFFQPACYVDLAENTTFKFNELRLRYLEALVRPCLTDLLDQQTIVRTKLPATGALTKRKRSSGNQTTKGPPFKVRRPLGKTTMRLPAIPLTTIVAADSDCKKWEACIRGAAEKADLRADEVIAAWNEAPSQQPLHFRLRVLQCICEVSNSASISSIQDALQPKPDCETAIEPSEQDVAHLGRMVQDICKFQKAAQGFSTSISFALAVQLVQFAWNFNEAVTTRKRINNREKDARYKRKKKEGVVRDDGNQAHHEADGTSKTKQVRGPAIKTKLFEELETSLGKSRAEITMLLDQGLKLDMFLGGGPEKLDLRWLCLFFSDQPLGLHPGTPILDLMACDPPEALQVLKPLPKVEE
ncbi:hypothetical protein GTA08_BOTSDO12675 [Botryosphaeria dothidea]|uniref:Uncharacterized protein n=1 Tax=Botryosphaeria dothidea TaxID=55169 RepID=A0A8H4J4D6_9PEZI|nr:hypothetical protein GTA08_BOTSDO12675 [Botryosphaeria dothidea]